MLPSIESFLSWNRDSPSARLASENGFELGKGTSAGLWKRACNAKSPGSASPAFETSSCSLPQSKSDVSDFDIVLSGQTRINPRLAGGRLGRGVCRNVGAWPY